MIDGLRRQGCEVVAEGWSAHTAGRESLATKVLGRSRDLWRVRRRIREWRPDVVYVATTHNWPALLRDIPLRLVVPRGGPPLVLHLHGSECGRFGSPGSRVFGWLSAWLVRRVAAVLLLSTEELELWNRFCPRARFELVRNPFVPPVAGAEVAPVARHGGAPHRLPTLLFVGRLVQDKGVFDLIDAFDIVRRQRPSRLSLAGTGPGRDAVLRRIAALGLGACVALLGYVADDDLDRAYGSADVFVLPSYREGFPLVIMEAMSYGLPIVTTPIRGCADHLVSGENALFVPPRDPEALADQLLLLLDADALRVRMGAANQAKLAEFAPHVVIPTYLSILRSVVLTSHGVS
jgi:glycosyltransferase involved in cell wall biosynthesis